MKPAATTIDWPPANATLREALEGELSRHFGSPCSVLALSRQPYAYQTSFPLEELVIDLANGPQLHLLCKCTSWNCLSESARKAKPRFLHDPLREIETYRLLLSSRALGTPIFYGCIVNAHQERYWLFVEKVSGRELYQVGEFAIWKEVARWLAGFHSSFRALAQVQELGPQSHLVHFNGMYYRRWIERALIFSEAQNRPIAIRQHLQRLAARFDRLLDRLQPLTSTFVHGEFYASNILVQQKPSDLRVAPVDWELAGVGPGLIDLAALVAGKWTQAQRDELARAYREAIIDGKDGLSPADTFTQGLDACRLLLAIQWLGWSQDWVPPREHSHDWLSEALDLADKLGL